MKILIIKLSSFGDIIHALPALDDLLRRPEVSEVHWLMDARFAFAAELLPKRVTSHIVALKGRGGLRNGMAMARKLKRIGFDLVLDLQGLIKSGLIARAIGAPAYGFDRRQSPEWPNRWLVRPVPFHDQERHVVQCYRRIAAAPFTGSTPPEAPIDYQPPRVKLSPSWITAGRKRRQRWGLPGRFAILHVGGSYPTKRLPDAQWRLLAWEVSQHLPLLILWGNAEERHRAVWIEESVEDTFAAEERLPITTLAGLLTTAAGYIGADSGVTHLAAAVGCPTVTLWGPTAPWRMGAIGERHRDVVADAPCAPCFKRRCRNFVCMPSLSEERICTAFRECIGKR